MLVAEQVSVSFGGVRAVDDVTLEVAAGSVLGLVGPNGSGKSTLLNAIGGFVRAEGRVRVADTVVRLGEPRASRRAGIMRTFQTPQLFDDLTCLENVALASNDRRATGVVAACLVRPLVRRHEKARWSSAAEAMAVVGVEHLLGRRASSITFSERRLLELARALVAEPKVILLDEPTAGLNDAETEQFGDVLTRVRGDEVALVVVDHKIDFIDALSDEIVVLELGHVIARGPGDQVWRDQRVIDAYLGADHAQP